MWLAPTASRTWQSTWRAPRSLSNPAKTPRMRLFVALNLPPSVRESIHADVEPLRTATTGIRWTAASALHVTLKFLGEQDERLVDPLRDALETVAARHSPVAVETTRVGAFPNFRRPRVVWVGMTAEKVLQALARDVDQTLAPLGFPPESRAFQAHLTLGRVRGELNAQEAAAVAKAADAVRTSRGFAVQTVDLMRSELGPGGSRYSLLTAAPLHARGT
jgi:RNA 2',3'-cyclic 3'-phosphodiesterase